MIFIEYDSTGKILTCTHGEEECYMQSVTAGNLTLIVDNLIDIFNNRVDISSNPHVVVDIPSAPSPPPVQTTAPSREQLVERLGWVQQNVLTKGITVNTAATGDPVVNILCDGAPSTQASLALLLAFGQAYPESTKIWEDNNGVFTTVTGSNLVSLATQIGSWITATYAAKPAFITQINDGTITTFAQVEALIWPT